ncbi:MAG: chemotaxis protein CheW [Spirochaetia bacterium]|nr:chemotaxis protein CheW [Spirochaetia bacterium]
MSKETSNQKKGSSLLDKIDYSYLKDFTDAAEEHLQEIEEELLEIEKNPENLKPVENIFRCFHSIKGDSASVGLSPISEVTHETEEIFDLIRENKMKISKVLIDAVFETINVIRYFMTTVSQKKEPQQNISWLLEKFNYIKTTPFEELDENKDDFGFELAQKENETTDIDDDNELDESSINTYVMFRVGKINCALPLYKTEEVVENLALTRIPFIEDFIDGAVNLRGSIVPVVNLRKKFNMPASIDVYNKILITSFNNNKIGLNVDEVFAIEEILPEKISEPGGDLIALDNSLVSGVFKSHGVLVFLLSYEMVLDKSKKANLNLNN